MGHAAPPPRSTKRSARAAGALQGEGRRASIEPAGGPQIAELELRNLHLESVLWSRRHERASGTTSSRGRLASIRRQLDSLMADQGSGCCLRPVCADDRHRVAKLERKSREQAEMLEACAQVCVAESKAKTALIKDLEESRRREAALREQLELLLGRNARRKARRAARGEKGGREEQKGRRR